MHGDIGDIPVAEDDAGSLAIDPDRNGLVGFNGQLPGCGGRREQGARQCQGA